MLEDWLIAVVPNVLVALFSFAMGYLAFKDGSRPYHRWFVLQSVAIGILALVLMVEKFFVEIDIYLSLVIVEYLAEIVAMVSLYVFVMNYTDRPKYADRKVVILLAAIGLMCVSLLVSNNWHHLWYESNSVVQQAGLVIVENVYGPAYVIWVAFSLYILSSCLVVLLASYIHAPKTDRVKYGFVGLAIFCMIAATAIYWVSAKDNPLLDILALGLFGGTVILFYGAFWKSMLDAPPLSILELLENVMDGAALVNEQGEVAYWNQAAKKILTDVDGKVLSTDLWLKDMPEYDVKLAVGADESIINIRCRLVPPETGSEGRVLILRDVTERRRTEKALVDAYQNISVMQSISRHDIKNDLLVISGYMDLIAEAGDEKVKQRCAQVKKVLGRMEHHVQQAHDVPDVLSQEFEWRDVEGMARTALVHHDLKGVIVDCDLKHIEVWSNHMFSNIFFNLADNSLRHGEGLTRIRLSHHVDGDDLVIIFEDDGVGISPENKERIFDRGFGKNTGMGLYLAREIAGLNMISIMETGGTGARFEMRVPSGRWHRS